MKYSLKLIMIIAIVFLQQNAFANAHFADLQPFDSCKNTDLVYFRCTNGQLSLHRLPSDTLSKRDALSWKIVSFSIIYHEEDVESFSIWNQLGNTILSSIIQKIRQRRDECVCVFIDDLKIKSIYTGEVMRLPSGFIKIPKCNSSDSASISCKRNIDPADNSNYISLPVKPEKEVFDFMAHFYN